MKTNINIFFLLLFIPLSIDLFSENIEEIVVKGDWRESSILEEDSSIVILDSKILDSQLIKHFKNLLFRLKYEFTRKK